MTYKPHCEPLPFALHGKNIRAVASQHHWNKLRAKTLAANGPLCSVCKKIPKTLYAHEVWRVDEGSEPAVAYLVTLRMVCFHCHGVEHFGFISAMSSTLPNAVEDTITHFCKVNAVTRNHWEAHLQEAGEVWSRRNKLRWRIDYGPFLEWAYNNLTEDILNGSPWPEELASRWPDPEPFSLALVSLPGA